MTLALKKPMKYAIKWRNQPKLNMNVLKYLDINTEYKK